MGLIVIASALLMLVGNAFTDATRLDWLGGRLEELSSDWDSSRCQGPLYASQVVRDVMGRVVSHKASFSLPQSTAARSRATPWRGYSYDALGRLDRAYEHDGIQTVVATATLASNAVNPDVGAIASSYSADDWRYGRESAVGSTVSITRQSDNAQRFSLVSARAGGYQLRGIEVDNASRTVTHDTEGRITDDGVRLFDFDALNRLAQVNGGSEGYAYDGVGRLVARYQGGVRAEVFLYDGHQMAVSLDGAGAANWEAVWGEGVDQLLEWRKLQGGAQSRQLPLVDARNSVIGSYDVATRTVTQTAEYTPEGRLLVRNPDGTPLCEEGGTGSICAAPGGMPFAFTSAWRAPTTGLVYLRNRWYSPELAEFLSHDPAGYPDSFNPYAYVGFDPINGWDPFGLDGRGFVGEDISPVTPLSRENLTPRKLPPLNEFDSEGFRRSPRIILDRPVSTAPKLQEFLHDDERYRRRRLRRQELQARAALVAGGLVLGVASGGIGIGVGTLTGSAGMGSAAVVTAGTASGVAIEYGPTGTVTPSGAALSLVGGTVAGVLVKTGTATNAAKDTTKLYRAVSEAEFQQLQKTGTFQAGPSSLGGKWFAESADDAAKWGDVLNGKGNSRIVETTLPKSTADQLMRLERLDGIGPARYGELDQLTGAVIREVK